MSSATFPKGAPTSQILRVPLPFSYDVERHPTRRCPNIVNPKESSPLLLRILPRRTGVTVTTPLFNIISVVKPLSHFASCTSKYPPQQAFLVERPGNSIYSRSTLNPADQLLITTGAGTDGVDNSSSTMTPWDFLCSSSFSY